MNNQDSSITLTREELYTAVWKEPMTRVAPRFGLSDVGLAKICRKFDIPRPPVGYWTKLAHGKDVEKPPLPDLEEADLIEIRRFREAFLAEQHSAIPKAPPKVIVAERLANPHPHIVLTKAILSEATPDRQGLVGDHGPKCLAICVSPKMLPRALRIFDALIKYWESQGGVVTLDGTRFWRDEDGVPVKLVEIVRRYERNPSKRRYWKDWSYEPTGRLSLEIEDWGDGLRKKWADGKIQRVENVLGRVVQTLEDWVELTRRRRIDAECEQRQKKKAAERRMRVERKKQEEESRREQLLSFVTEWERAERIRTYLAALESTIERKEVAPTNPEGFSEWLEWAHWYADFSCPITPTRPRDESIETPENTRIDDLDLRGQTKAILTASAIGDSDALYKLSREQVRELCHHRDWTVWSEINLVLEGLGYDISDRATW